jgi:prophage antirepressor-like protein
VCRVLDLSNPSVAVKALRPDEWSKKNLGLRGRGGVLILSESGLYKMVMRSNKSEALDFQDWIAREVLPSIRKNGGYILGEEKDVTGDLGGVRIPRQPADNACLPKSASESAQGWLAD